MKSVAQDEGKDRVETAEFEYRRNRTGKTRYEVSLAKANADEVAREKSDAMAADKEAVPVKEAKAAEPAAKVDAKARTKTSNADEKTAKARTTA